MRALTLDEMRVMRWFADHVGESGRLSLLEDLEDTMVEEIRDEHLTLRFQKWGDPSDGIDSYMRSFATASDADGADLALTLWLNLDGSPYELHVRRLEAGPVQNPDWANLRAVTREEFVRFLEKLSAAN